MILWKLCYYPQTTGLIVAQREKDLREKAFRNLQDMFALKLQQMPASHQTSMQLKIDHGRCGYSVCFGEWAATEGQSRGDSSKGKMLYSPDIADAFAMTFYSQESQYYHDKQAYLTPDFTSDWDPYAI